MNRIICIGNPYRPEDMAGPLVYQRLAHTKLPPGVEVIDGGLGGLNLLPFMESADRVVFVDAVRGFGNPSEVVVIEGADIDSWECGRFDHSAGLGYLLRILPALCETRVPLITLVGIEGPPTGRSVAQAASVALGIGTGMTGSEAVH